MDTDNPVIVANVLFDDRIGGPQKRVIEVGAGLLKASAIETLVVLPEGLGAAESASRDAGLGARRVRGAFLPSLNRPGTVVRWLVHFLPVTVRFARLFRREGIHVVHVNGAFFLQPALAARIAGARLVWHLNDTLVPGPVARMLGWIVAGLAHRIVLAAGAVGDHYGVSPDRASVIYAPVDPDAFVGVVGASGAGRGRRRIGMLGNWNPLKGHDLFLGAVDRLRREHGWEVRAVLGGGRLESQIRYAEEVVSLRSELGLEEVVEEPGFVEDVPAFMAGLDVFVLSSRAEACPMVVLEAMAAGVPVVATDVGGVRELLLHGRQPAAGLVVPVDPEALAEAVDRVLRDSALRDALSDAGPRRVRERFSLSACVDAHRDVYRSVIEGSAVS